MLKKQFLQEKHKAHKAQMPVKPRSQELLEKVPCARAIHVPAGTVFLPLP